MLLRACQKHSALWLRRFGVAWFVSSLCLYKTVLVFLGCVSASFTRCFWRLLCVFLVGVGFCFVFVRVASMVPLGLMLSPICRHPTVVPKRVVASGINTGLSSIQIDIFNPISWVNGAFCSPFVKNALTLFSCAKDSTSLFVASFSERIETIETWCPFLKIGQ